MSAYIKQKSPIQSFNTYMFTALFCVFITGLILILLVFIFGIPIFGQSSQSNIYFGVLQVLSILIINLGLGLIILGLYYSIGFMKRIKKLIDLVISGKVIDTGETIYQSPVQHSTGIGGKIQVIRPQMTTTESSSKSKTSKTITKEEKPKEERLVSKESITKDNKKTPTEKIEENEDIEITLEEALHKILERYNEQKVKKSFSGWENTLMMTFPDIDKSYLFKINGDQGIELSEGYEEEAEVQVKVDSEIYRKMMNKQINPIKAYSSGKLEVVGKMRTLLKLRKLMF